ncbi:MAG: 16S rRNA processing protein RimM [Clostridia bacterium]|nr:16S rRNA processing protein RimM [Clostridia bacterium]
MDHFRIGLFLRPHGVHGEIKIKPLTDDVSRFKKLREAFVEMQENSFTPVAVTSSKILSGNGVAVKIDGYNTVEQAESLHGKYLCVDRAHAVKLPEGTYFVSDLISCRVVSSDGDELGFIEDIYETNANDVYVVRGKQKLSVPALKKLLDRVDVENKLIVFNAQVLSEVGLFED